MTSYGAMKQIATMEKPMKKAKKMMDHMRISEGENGGHMVEHHFVGMEHEPEQHMFGEGEGKEMMAHIMKYAHVTMQEESPDEEASHDSAHEEIEA